MGVDLVGGLRKKCGQYFQYFRHKKTVEKSTALFHSGMLIIQPLKYDKRWLCLLIHHLVLIKQDHLKLNNLFLLIG